jgi:hypothetical protein
MRIIGLDVHRSFAVAALLENGQLRSGDGSSSHATRSLRSATGCGRMTRW